MTCTCTIAAPWPAKPTSATPQYIGRRWQSPSWADRDKLIVEGPRATNPRLFLFVLQMRPEAWILNPNESSSQDDFEVGSANSHGSACDCGRGRGSDWDRLW